MKNPLSSGDYVCLDHSWSTDGTKHLSNFAFLTDSPSERTIPNPHTQAASCPVGYDAKLIARITVTDAGPGSVFIFFYCEISLETTPPEILEQIGFNVTRNSADGIPYLDPEEFDSKQGKRSKKCADLVSGLLS